MRLLVAGIVFIFTFFIGISSMAQTTEVLNHTAEEQLENNAENKEGNETEDDAWLQRMEQFIKAPVNLNTAGETDLQELLILTPLQINELIHYRNVFGKFIDVYELQAIPYWDAATIKKIRPYITVSDNPDLLATLKTRLATGQRSVMLRASMVAESAKGFSHNDSSTTGYYAGSPQKILFRYKYAYKTALQYGILGEKDAGEAFFRGRQKQGFDFYSAHFFVRNIGMIRALALGDFTVNLGQGLIQWQSLAFKKTAAVMSIKRDGPILRPYNSAGEINFHRGIGITLAKGHWQSTGFVSKKRIDANFVPDTTGNGAGWVSSLQNSGYHRTVAELTDKGVQHQFAFGGNIAYRFRQLYLGFNGIHYTFSLPLKKAGDPYVKYAFQGNKMGNYSVDYSYTFRNMHFFGEFASGAGFHRAVVQGLLVSVAAFADLSLVYRNISKAYQSLNANAFTEAAYPGNEKGLYTGITIRPNAYWQVNAYADLYAFPWLKYRVDAPSEGNDLMLQVTYKPNKQLELYTRYRAEKKAINATSASAALPGIIIQPKQNWRTQLIYSVNRELVFRGRVEMNWFDKHGGEPEQGFLCAADLLYKPFLKAWSGNLRLLYFETNGYNSRIYAFENDVLYNFSIPVFYDKGLRYYINLHYDFNKKFRAWIKWAQTVYPDRNTVGSGLDEIAGNHKAEIRIQVQYDF